MISDPVFDAFYPAALASKNLEELKQIVRDANERVARQHILSPWCNRIFSAWYNRGSKAITVNSGRRQTTINYCHFIWHDSG
jgi:hypothetical protein